MDLRSGFEKWIGEVDWKSGLEKWIGEVDWRRGLEKWIGEVDWRSGLVQFCLPSLWNDYLLFDKIQLPGLSLLNTKIVFKK